jgi:tol-pal system protein YbgF
MVTPRDLQKLLLAMIRSALVPLLALACALCANAARAQSSDAELVTRIGRLEAAIRDLTGNIEQLQYRNQQLEQQVQRLQAEVQGATAAASSAPPRPTGQYTPPAVATAPGMASAPARPVPQYPSPAANTPVVASVPVPAAPIEQGPVPSPPRRGDAFDPAANPNAPGAPRPLGSSTAANEPPPVAETPSSNQRPLGAPLDLSPVSGPLPAAAGPANQLPPPPPANPSATGAMQATLPPSGSAKDEYDLAYGYVLHKDYGLAANAFRVFLRQYPSDRLAPEALYWLGESLYQQQQYRDAAESFLAVSTKYDSTARAPEALLRLGQSLAALGEKEAACASLGEVLRKYPRASQNLKQSVDREQKRGHC